MSFFTSVKQAEPEDTQAIMRLLVNTAEWLLSKGSSQWNALLRGEDSHNTPEAIEQGEVFIFKQDTQLVGMFMLQKEQSKWDRELWGEETDKSSVYLHRLAINRKFAGKGIGKQMMLWVNSGIPYPGKNTIKLDCASNNTILNAFYRELGYDFKGLAVNEYGEFSKFEKKI
ncbi:GNAT family N-acetyltransferase [Cohnella abietis]|uniref:Putative N-acetyltransferase YesJ n=1 Tax=Cohnella abietis TaxID=2507935 RepID=A0A3T1D814_9BACL|nr:GNAT family N-acetyltransferase [Cohnella abietis]BBI34214.1 putative N-acetyltransferase YesJ [Cohnella abietis]